MRIGDTIQSFDVLQLPVREMRVESDAEQAIILVNRGNSFFNYTQQTTVYRGVGFVNMSIAVESDVEGISVDWIRFIVNIKGEAIIRNNTVGLLDEGVKVLGQLIFAEQQPSVHVVTSENPSGLLLDYNLQGKSKGEIQLLVGVLSVTDDLTVYQDPETKANYINDILIANHNASQGVGFLKPSPEKEDLPLDVFDYQKAVTDWAISYVACRDSELIPKFANDPVFSLVFINDKVALFMVKRSFSQMGRAPSS